MPDAVRVVVAEDDAALREVIVSALEHAGLACVEAADGVAALEHVRSGQASIVLSDVAMPRMSGAELLDAVRSINPEIPFLVMTGNATIDGAVDLLRRGAYDYIAKPFRVEELARRVENAAERLRLGDELRRLRGAIGDAAGPRHILGSSAAIRRLLEQLPQVARTTASVLLTGESGTGKEVVARAVHALSPRARRPFVALNCGAFPETLLESELFGHVRGAFTDAREDRAGLVASAEGGTLFLDEVGDLPPAVQVKLLRFLQEREYRPLGATRTRTADVRIVAATNADLRRAIADGKFREDLFYRLNVIPLALPPLRERKEDIPALARHFLARYREEFGAPVESFAPLALQKLVAHDWPGNVRELENKVQQLVALAPTSVILPEQIELPSATALTRPDGRLKSFRQAKREAVDTFEVSYLTHTLALAGGNISRAARLAGKHRRAYWELLRRHGIEARVGALPGMLEPGESDGDGADGDLVDPDDDSEDPDGEDGA